MATATGRWSEAEHKAFEDGLKRFGTNWRAIARLVPTRTLVQIRTHAQKYFLKHGMPARNDSGGGDGDVDMDGGGGDAPTSAGFTVAPVATLRHVALEPLHPGDGLGITFAMDSTGTAVLVQGFMPVESASSSMPPGPISIALPTGMLMASNGAAAQADTSMTSIPIAEKSLTTGVAEESDLVRVGDVMLGVSGVCVTGMDTQLVNRVISIARASTPGGIVVLHLCDVPIDASLVEEASIQMANAAAQLLASRQAVENVQAAVYQALLAAPSEELAARSVPVPSAPPPALGMHMMAA